MSNALPLPGNFVAPVYTYGAVKSLYESNLLRLPRHRQATARPYPYTSAEGLRHVDFERGSFEVYL